MMGLHPLEAHYDAVFTGIGVFLSVDDLRSISSVSTALRRLIRKTDTDQRFWREHFEVSLGRCFAGISAGITSWRWKSLAFSTKGAKGLMMSPEVFDFQLGCSLLSSSEVRNISAEVVSYALRECHEEVIRYMIRAAGKEADFRSQVEVGFMGCLSFTRGGITVREEFPVSTFRILLDSSLESSRFFTGALRSAIRQGRADVVALLCASSGGSLVYSNYDCLFEAALKQNVTIFSILLDHVESCVDAGIVKDVLTLPCCEEIKRVLKNHPRTREHFLPTGTWGEYQW